MLLLINFFLWISQLINTQHLVGSQLHLQLISAQPMSSAFPAERSSKVNQPKFAITNDEWTKGTVPKEHK